MECRLDLPYDGTSNDDRILSIAALWWDTTVVDAAMSSVVVSFFFLLVGKRLLYNKLYQLTLQSCHEWCFYIRCLCWVNGYWKHSFGDWMKKNNSAAFLTCLGVRRTGRIIPILWTGRILWIIVRIIDTIRRNGLGATMGLVLQLAANSLIRGRRIIRGILTVV